MAVSPRGMVSIRLVKPGRELLVVVAACVGIRLGFLLLVEPWALATEAQATLHNDSQGYHLLALSLLERGEFSTGAGVPPNTLRTPGYPLFVAALYSLFGSRPWAVMLSQVALEGATVALLFRVLARALGTRAALAGALLYAIDPIVVLYDTALLSEALFAFCLVVGLAAGLGALDAAEPRRRFGAYALLGGAVGVGTLVRPAAQYLPLFLLPLLLWLEQRPPWRGAAYAAVFLAAFTCAIAPWLVRNHQRYGAIALSTSGPYNLLFMNVGTVEATRRGVKLATAGHELLAEADRRMRAVGEDPREHPYRRAEFQLELAEAYVREHPLEFAYHHATGTLFQFANLGTSDFARVLGRKWREVERTRGAVRSFLEQKGAAEWRIAAVVAALLAAIYGLVALGLAVAWKRHDRRVLLWLLVPATYFVVTPGAFGIARFRIPAMPFLVGFAGIGAVFLAELLRARRAALKRAA